MYLFALFLVLYEFTAYSANDMIMPGMIQVVNYFHVPTYYAAQSLSYYLLGNCLFLLMAGYLAERYGKRNTILLGNLLFLLFSIIAIFSATIHQFLFWRFLQGSGLAIIAIGYALIHENFDDKTAVKLIALMANVSLLAPLMGPALGSLIMSFLSWQYIFGLSAILSLFTLIGLYQFTPQNKNQFVATTSYQMIRNYRSILKNKTFFHGMLCSTFILIPLLLWIAEAPSLILYKLQLDYVHYVIYQIISIGGLTLSSIIMQVIVGKYRLYSIVMIGALFISLGLITLIIGTHYIAMIAIGILIYALGLGLANGCIWRLVMTIKGYPHSILASMLGFFQTLLLFVSLMLVNKLISYYHFELLSFTLSFFIFGGIGFLLLVKYISAYKNREWR